MDVDLSCRCGKVRARAVAAEPHNVNYVICYCRDCRAFARWLDRLDLCDAAGGSPIVQMARGRVDFTSGLDEVACVRLSEKGLFRWYAACCKTPIGNTIPKVPFIGVVGAFFANDGGPGALYGTPWLVQTDGATGTVPAHRWVGPMFLRLARLIAGWALRGLKGDTLFDRATSRPRVPPKLLTPSERAAIAD